MLLFYHSWVFYNHFIATLYNFLGLTYWHSAQCQLLFSTCFYIAGNQYQTESKRSETSWGFFWARRHPVGQESTWGGCYEGSTTHQGALGGPGAPRWVVPTSGTPWTASLLYKYPNIPETLGETTKINSSRRRVQKHQLQSRHHLGGVHHVHWCLSDDAWVVLCRPTGR